MNCILVALDGSERAKHVLAAAVNIAKSTGAKLSLYRAVSVPAELPALALSMSPGDFSGLLQDLAGKGLAELAATIPAELLGGTEVSLAIPWQGVCEAAHRMKADLIVVGSHGYGGFDRLLGTTAAKIVNHADRSVLVVK